jgi:hypothetical protein
MSVPTLTPASQTSAITLPATGAHGNVNTSTNPLPFGIYTGVAPKQLSSDFVSGAVDQVSYVYKKLGGDVLDVEITEYQVYAAYEEAVLEYSYIVNIHQAKNALPNVLGNTTGTFDHDGEIKTGPASASLRYPRFDYAHSKRVSEGISTDIGLNGTETIYSASVDIEAHQPDYDLQSVVYSASTSDSTVPYYGLIDSYENAPELRRKILVKKVYYKSPYVMWRFFGYYGGLSVIGNLHNYGQWSDDSTFEIMPTWQNKLQAMAFDDSVYTRVSHYSYELKNNKLRVYPTPGSHSPNKMWFEFIIARDAWDEDYDRTTGIKGVNNMNSLPFANIPYAHINSIGKQWIRRFSLALCKEMLGQIRGKFSTLPIPGESVTLNHSELISQAKDEQDKLREELKTVLDEMTYPKLVAQESTMVEDAMKTQQNVPIPIFVG